MPPIELLLPFFVASTVFACIPGPGMFYAAAQTMARGRHAGWLSALGFHLGGFVHILAAAFGVAILLQTVPILFAIVKFAGAGYLVWLGLKLFNVSERLVVPVRGDANRPAGKALRDSIIVEILNPKTALFYLAFLPQFTTVSASLPIWAQVLILGSIVNIMFSVTDAVCIVFSDVVTRRMLKSQRIGNIARRMAGGVLIVLGLNLAISRQ